MADDRKTNTDAQSTWGATREAKQAWHDQQGDKVRKAVAKENEKAASE
jgi:hypothetical protein